MRAHVVTLALAVGALACACESGLSATLQIGIGPDVLTPFSDEAPGIVRLSAASIGAHSMGAVCTGEDTSEFEARLDFGFGCVADRLGTEEEVIAWIEPLPEGFDATAVCPASTPLGEEIGVSGELVDDGQGGETAATLPDAPSDDVPQGTGSMLWSRDGSPCGGRAEGDVLISALIGG